MTKTVTSLFHSVQHAIHAASRLKQAGIPSDRIDIWSVPINLAPVLQDAGVSRSDTQAYVEGVLRGGTVIIVSCADEEVDRAVSILDDEGVLDLDEQQASWRSEGWEGPAAAGPPGDLTASSGSAQADAAAPDQPHEMSHGRVRVRSHEEDRPARK
jgi:hypothetical protein